MVTGVLEHRLFEYRIQLVKRELAAGYCSHSDNFILPEKHIKTQNERLLSQTTTIITILTALNHCRYKSNPKVSRTNDCAHL